MQTRLPWRKPAAYAGEYGNVRRQQKRLYDDRLRGKWIDRQYRVRVHVAYNAQIGCEGDGLDAPSEDHDAAALADDRRNLQDVLAQSGFITGNDLSADLGGIPASVFHAVLLLAASVWF